MAESLKYLRVVVPRSLIDMCTVHACKGKATTRSTEMRHWSEYVGLGSGTFDYDSESSDQSDMEPTIMDI